MEKLADRAVRELDREHTVEEGLAKALQAIAALPPGFSIRHQADGAWTLWLDVPQHERMLREAPSFHQLTFELMLILEAMTGLRSMPGEMGEMVIDFSKEVYGDVFPDDND